MLFRVVSLYLSKHSIYTAYSRLYNQFDNMIADSQWCKERFIVHFTFKWWCNPLRIYGRLQTL